MTRWSLPLFACIFCCVALTRAAGCQDDSTCGWKAQCKNGLCTCPSGYFLHSNQRDCHRNICTVEDCLECDTNNVCQRCTNFLSEQTSQCLQKCNGEAKIVDKGAFQSSVCTEFTKDGNLDIIIGVAVGVSAGVVLCVVIGMCFYCHLRKTRKNINLQQKKYRAENLERGKLTTIPTYDNKGFETDMESLRNPVIDKDVYLLELEKLRPKAGTFLILLNEIRRKLRSMDKTDPRISTYKGVIHQMCRVLVLLHKKDPVLSIPSDALGLLEWAQQMLDDYHLDSQDQFVSEGSSEMTTSKISYIDVPEEHQQHVVHQYAVPNVHRQQQHKGDNPHGGHGHQNSLLSFNSDGGYYSSTPVPVEYHSNTLPQTNIRGVNSTFKPHSKFQKNKEDTRRTKSATNIHHAYQGSDLSMGYFSNGRYYDPGPQPEIYAPASSYSDRSNHRWSTFRAPDHDMRTRGQSLSSSAANSDPEDIGPVSDNDDSPNDVDDKDSDEEDILPFDPKDATDPVEV